MNFSKTKLLVSFFLIVVFWVVPASALDVGEKAPGFTLKSITGEEVSLADYKGRIVLLKLATTWCPTCKQLSGEISKIGDALKEKDVVYLEVFVQDSEKMIKKYLKGEQLPMTFHALMDDGQAYKGYNVYLIPRLLVIDAEQAVRFDTAGRSIKADDILKLVDEASAGTGKTSS